MPYAVVRPDGMDDEERWYDGIGSLLWVIAGLVAGAVLGGWVFVWGVAALHDLLHVPELSPVPIEDRAPGVAGPTFAYWLAWAIPPLVVYPIGAYLAWSWRPGRWPVIATLTGFTSAALMIVPIWISMEVGGFAPT
ncbi:hypothetical protein [Antrihabitans cavernicola]|uniref:Uncharacterized protein n=1 Tax=Antrihabitans cavernicola TaxID=2495913 RepID=A0A5A7SCY6_9NOCA|nr:hypothetical protein [Spelaeibacter cavernicola]KAA0022071.1 hypothetical protein FOY51_16995 [Spelaeibacter cavernicola]